MPLDAYAQWCAMGLVHIHGETIPAIFSRVDALHGANPENELTILRVRNDNRGRGYAAYTYRIGVEWDMTYATR